MLTEILTSVIVSLSFTIGFFLYRFTKEEIDSLKIKVKSVYGMVFAGILGTIQGFVSIESSLILLAAGIIFSSMVFSGKNKIESLRALGMLTAVFFICFVISFYANAFL